MLVVKRPVLRFLTAGLQFVVVYWQQSQSLDKRIGLDISVGLEFQFSVIWLLFSYVW